jgi:type II secretory pathway predicted ATPase ExeA/phage tail protein X
MYIDFYGFREKPFELTPDPRFIFLTPDLRKALASVIYGIKERTGFISVIGEAGTGKTTLIHSLLSSLDTKVKPIIIFHTTVSFNDLLKMILRELDLWAVEKNKKGLWDQLIRYSNQIAAKNEILAIIIDEAHKLPEEVMEELEAFSNLESKAIKIVLVGQPELEDKLNLGGPRQLNRMIRVRCQIKALDEEESKEYIDHRLRLVGSSSLETFTPEAVSMICRYADGIPRIINTLCDNALLAGYRLYQKKIDARIIREMIKDMEGPSPERTIPSASVSINRFRTLPFRSKFVLNKVSFVFLFLFLLGGFFLLIHRNSSQRPDKMWGLKSIISPHVQTELSSTSTSSRMTPPSASMAAMEREYKLREVVAIRKGQTVSQLTQKYYGRVDLTLIDFLLDLNPEITNVHLIMVDQEIKIPHITKELLVIRSPDRTYEIHAGTFETPDPAKFYNDEPALKGKKIEILPRKVSPRETWYRVVIGRFDNKDEALKMISLLKEKGLLPAFGGLRGIE